MRKVRLTKNGPGQRGLRAGGEAPGHFKGDGAPLTGPVLALGAASRLSSGLALVQSTAGAIGSEAVRTPSQVWRHSEEAPDHDGSARPRLRESERGRIGQTVGGRVPGVEGGYVERDSRGCITY
jgi:hypothetical protein